MSEDIVTTGDQVQMASSGERPEMLLNTLQSTGQAPCKELSGPPQQILLLLSNPA